MKFVLVCSNLQCWVWILTIVKRYSLVSYSCFNLQFPNDQWCWGLFHMLTFHPYIFFYNKFVWNFCSVLKSGLFVLLFWGFKFPHAFQIQVPYETCVWQIFSFSLWLVFFLLLTRSSSSLHCFPIFNFVDFCPSFYFFSSVGFRPKLLLFLQFPKVHT